MSSPTSPATASTSSDTLSLSSSRSSTKSNMHIAMPAQTDFSNPGGVGSNSSSSNPTYVTASMPSPAQNPHNTTWGSPSPSHSPSSHRHHHIHIPTPHPLAAATSFLDKHVPLFSKHHNEFSVNHEARAARREARRSLVVDAIPEVDVEHLPAPPSNSNSSGGVIATAIHAATATGAGPALADSRAADNAAWRDILAKREAARRRAGSDDMQMHRSIAEEGSDEDSSSRGYKGSPAITP
ncbi:uncharacterized protein A1O9_10029 [Exophiala aquamarina CBS 119918]|uniref:Uncharacterized protein n=1 Tax=Exophiala aquamarina CBS 119918 TaxID=1182545 RepID=A0A072PDH8_9EURO|nr:uncharacterized protein A1O9_10029 [Exophiala aquamarina CBS 119918]KEF53630.1 hypothetical protein A1O9_10029 [Exophiala aquamarina CBS 119918]